MEVTGTSASDPVYAQQNSSQTQELDQTAFMKLLVTQLENQDPLEPVTNEDFIAQLATFSSLEELEGLNDNIVAMIAFNQSNALLAQLTQGSALIGRQVNWQDPYTGEPGSGTVDSVKIVDGLAVMNIDGQDIPLATVTEILPEGSTTETGEETDGEDPGSETTDE